MLKWTACAPNALELYPELFERDDDDIPNWMESSQADIASAVEGKNRRPSTLVSGSSESKLDVQVKYSVEHVIHDHPSFQLCLQVLATSNIKVVRLSCDTKK